MSNFIINPYSFPTAVSNGLLNNLVSYWKSDTNGSFPDAHGSNNGTINGATYTASGKINGAYSFVTNDYIALPSGILSSGASWSLGGWINMDNKTTNNVLIALQNDYNIQVFYDTILSKMIVQTWDGSTAVNVGADISISSYHSVIATYDGTNVSMYIDGVLVDRATSNTPSAVAVANRIGAHRAGVTYTDGDIDEVAIWSTALSDGGVSVGQTAGGQIADHYNTGSGLSYDNFTT